MAQQPRGLKTLAEAFPDWEADSRWSQALKKVENSSRPYLKEVQRYEKYRCLARGARGQVGNPGFQLPWPIPAPISPWLYQASASFNPRFLTPWAPVSPPWLCTLEIRAWGP